jgi:hypothetical protein
MVMFDRFAAARHKIERANKHIADLEKVIFTLQNSYVATVERHESIRAQVIIYAIPDVPELGAAMALVIGDALHNLRTAIDYAYCGAIERHASTALDSYTKFPTAETREEVENRLRGRKIDILCPKLFERIATDIKPYTVGGNCLIKMLHDLDISDKHWLLIPVTRAVDARGIVVEDENGTLDTRDTNFVTGSGPYTVCLPLEYTIKDKGKLSIEVVFDDIEIGLLKGMPVMDDLKTFSKLSIHLVQVLDSI